MTASGNELAKEAADEKAGIKTTINKLAAKKRAERLAREAKQKRGR